MTRNCGVTFHASRHEEAAVAMADGYARVSSKLGVCSVHQGPGVTNTLTALTEAVKNGTPMLLLAGDTATTALYQNLDVDQDAVVRSIGAGVEHVRSAHTAVEDLARAVWRATTERRPVAVSLPIDLQEQSCEAEDPPAFAEEPIPAPRPSGEAITRVADLVEASSRPAIIADAAQSSFLQAALTAAFNAGAGILGFPAGGWLADYAKRKGWGRKIMLVSFTLIQGLLTLGFGFYIMNGGPVRARARRPAVYREPLLQRPAAHVPSPDRGPGAKRCIPRGGVRVVEPDRGDGSRPFSGHQRHAAGRDG